MQTALPSRSRASILSSGRANCATWTKACAGHARRGRPFGCLPPGPPQPLLPLAEAPLRPPATSSGPSGRADGPSYAGVTRAGPAPSGAATSRLATTDAVTAAAAAIAAADAALAPPPPPPPRQSGISDANPAATPLPPPPPAAAAAAPSTSAPSQ